jgi:K+-transporting ATPase ATPase B chain
MTTSTAPKAHSGHSSLHRHGDHAPGGRIEGGLLDPALLAKSLPDALRKLDPRTLWRNPVMFIVEIGAVWSTVLTVRDSSCFGFG